MADRYWVGGTGTWDASTTTNWATSSGGASGASAPTSADDVIFDANSNTLLLPFTVTIGTGAVCRDITAGSLDAVMTLAGSAAWTISGSLSFPATNLTRTFTGAITFNATTTGKTITTNGVALTGGGLTFNGVGGEWTLGSALSMSGSGGISISNGTLDVSVSNYSITSAAWSKTGGVFVPRNGTVTVTNASANFLGGSSTYYNVSFTSNAGGANTHTITGANTFNDLTFTSVAATGIRNISIGANQTVSGTLTLGAANTAIRRMFMRSDVVGTARTITAATVATLADVDFRDIVGAGLGTWSGTRLGNCGGNTGITLDAAKTVYRVGTGSWSATQWSLTSGGSVDVNNFPLAQDSAIFDTGTTTGTHTIDAGWNIGNLNMSALNVAVTLANGAVSNIYENLTLDADVTLTGAGGFTFSGVSNQTITSAGITFTQALTVNKTTTTSLILSDALTSNLGFTLTQGTLDLNNFNLTCLTFGSNNANTRAIAFGTGKIVVTGNAATVFNISTATNFSFTGTSRVEFNYSGSTGTRVVTHGNTGGSEVNCVNMYITAGSDIFSFTTGGINSYRTIDFTGFSGTFERNTVTTLRLYGDLIIPSTTTVSTTASPFLLDGTSGVTQSFTTNNKTLDFAITKSSTGALKLIDNLTMGSTRTLTLTAGTLDLNNQTLSTGLFVSSNSTTRSIAFGTGKIVVTGNNTAVLSIGIATNFTYTGTPTFDLTYSGSTGTRTCTFANSAGETESNVINIKVSAGTDIINLTTNSALKDVDFTGFAGTLNNTVLRFYGNVTYSSGMTLAAGASTIQYLKSTGTQTITTNSKTLDFPVTKSAAGTLQLLDNLTMGSTRTLTHTGGTLDLNDNTLTTGLYSSTGSTARQLDVGTGTLAVEGATFTASGSNYTTAGTGKVSMTSASSKTFAGGGFTYPTLNQGGAGNLIITGANTFTGITNTVQPATIIFPSSTTQNITNFNVSGTSGNLITIESSTSGTQATLNSPSNITNLVSYVSLKDNRGQGGIWQAPSNYNNTILTNVTGWFTGILHADTVVEPSVSNELSSYTIAYGVNVSEEIASNDVNVSQVIYNGNVLEDSTIADISSKNIVASAYANVIGIAFVSAYPNANYSGNGTINGNATIIAKGVIRGEGWSPITPSSDTWTDISAGTDIWTEVSPGTDTWLRQG